MSQTNSKLLTAIKLIRKDIGAEPCPEFNPDCAGCKLYILDGLLSWLEELEKD